MVGKHSSRANLGENAKKQTTQQNEIQTNNWIQNSDAVDYGFALHVVDWMS